ncbi:MAG: OmpH family outer membrane protein [Succinivibrionaceae bacterium]|nr:OmpH family outer membrane protein [Succinivibrionaceae bacterium]
MLKRIALAAAVAALVGTAQAAPEKTPAPATAVGVVNVQEIMISIPQAKASREALGKEFAPRQKELQDLEEKGRKLSEELNSGKYTGDKATEAQRKLQQMQADFNLKGQAFQEDREKRVQEEQMKLGQIVQKVIDDVAKERGLAVVIRGDAIVYAVNSVDLSQEIIDRVSKQAQKAGSGDKK